MNRIRRTIVQLGDRKYRVTYEDITGQPGGGRVVWTKEDDEALETLWKRGTAPKDIGRLLRRTSAAVSSRAHALRLKGHQLEPFRTSTKEKKHDRSKGKS